jgi:aminoglycoside phosphotransferase (APT) family kinase protein
MLWSRGRLTGIVDWTFPRLGPPDRDVGHCRLNLAVLFSAQLAEQFRALYETAAGRSVDRYWDLVALLRYSDDWTNFIPTQVNGLIPVDTAGMTQRVEDLVELTLRRS